MPKPQPNKLLIAEIMEQRGQIKTTARTSSVSKKVCILILFCLGSFIAAGQNMRYDTIRYAKDYYQKRITAFKNDRVLKNKVLFLGNSLTQFGDWSKLLGDSTVINRGIAGDNTFGVLERLNDIVILEPSKLFIEIGINDISQNIPHHVIIKNIKAIVQQVHASSPKTQIYFTSILPTNNNVKIEYPAAYHKDEQINRTNSAMKRNAARDNYIYIDLNNQLKDKNGELDIKYAKSDGIHLNQVGYDQWLKLIKSAMMM